MPRKQKDPIIDVMNYFETVSIDAAKLALVVVGGIVQRRSSVPRPRKTAETVSPEPLRSRAEEAVAPEPNPLDPKPKARTRKPREVVTAPMPAAPLPSKAEQALALPGIQATVGE